MITGKLYDWLKWIAQVFLPALGTLCFAITDNTDVVGIIMASDLFLGTILGISQVNYGKQIESAGDVVIGEDGKMTFQVNSDSIDVDKLGTKQEVRFKVKKEIKGDI